MNFLEQVAAYYAEPDRARLLADTVFVTPNKRAAMFLKMYLKRALTTTAFMPRMSTMKRLVSVLSGRPEISANEALFVLYDVYKQLLNDIGRSEQLRDFDRFVFWGQIMLNDFNEIDNYLADAAQLYRNLQNVKEITADYLTDEQKELVRNLWGATPLTEAVTDFWLHTGGGDKADVAQRFVALWELAGELYARFNKAIDDMGMSTPGRQYREAVRAVKDMAFDDPSPRRYVFVGFGRLSVAELAIMETLKRLGRADFFWDYGVAEIATPAYVKKLHPPVDFVGEAAADEAEIDIVGVPSKIVQATYAANVIEHWIDGRHVDVDNAINTAVVLPDESLLMPMLLSIPDKINTVNITMGVPYASTAFAGLFGSIIAMQLGATERHGRLCYFYEHVEAVLSHEHVALIAGRDADAIKQRMADCRMFVIDACQLCDDYPALAYVFKPVMRLNSVAEIEDYVLSLIDGLSHALATRAGAAAGKLTEIKMLDYFRECISALAHLITRYGIEMNERTYFALFERILRSQTINLNGTPLRGMQIMGMLETRALDFDNLVILSVNEGVLPRKQMRATLIPNNLRRGYGLPTVDDDQAEWEYYFFRLLARAKRVTLVYDSRERNFGGGEISRFVTRLRYLQPEGSRRRQKFFTLDLPSGARAAKAITVAKTDSVLAALRRFTPEGGTLNFSASALKTYHRCPLRFYLSFVRRQSTDGEIVDYADPLLLGTIAHKVIELIYAPFVGRSITAADLESLIDKGNTVVEENVRRAIEQLRYGNAPMPSLNSESRIMIPVLADMVRRMLHCEQLSYCTPSFRYVGGEVKIAFAWQIIPEMRINFKMVIDRVDEIEPGYLRFIDYKTGTSDDIKASSVDALFSGNRSGGMFQLMTYAEAYCDYIDSRMRIKPVLHPLIKLDGNEGISPLEIGRIAVDDAMDFHEEFRRGLEDIVTEIFDPAVPFTQCEKADACRFCSFLELCGRAGEIKGLPHN